MKHTSVKRGRPKKTDSKPVEPQQHPESIAFVNKRFIDKNGHVCTVMYGSCKAKPIDIRYGT